MNTQNFINDLSVYDNLLRSFKPILILYMPDSMLRSLYIENKLAITVSKLKEDTEDKYYILVIPSADDSIRIDLLSVLKSELVTDKDLESKIKKLQDDIIKK